MKESSAPRLRVFAGPNGSGKSTLHDKLSKIYPIGQFVNADSIEQELSTKGFLDLADFGLDANEKDLNTFLKAGTAISLIKKSEASGHPIHFELKQNVIVDASKDTHSYEAALISMFIRHKMQEKGLDYSFETVMSHPSKIEAIKEAKQYHYKTYLYFVCIDDPEVNVSRVLNRVAKGGHPVVEDKIKDRYIRTLENLLPAILKSDKAYLFDNSDKELALIAKVINGKLILATDPEKLPNWFIDYVLPSYI